MLDSLSHPEIFQPKILETNALIPAAWRQNGDDPWTFNPSIMPRSDGTYSISYRVAKRGSNGIRQDPATHTGWLRMACAVLDKDFNVVPGSVVPLSDLIEFPENPKYSSRTKTRHEDPRLFELNDGLYVTWNDGVLGVDANRQFRVKLHPVSLTPITKAQELVVTGFKRRPDEKNWVFYEADDSNGAGKLSMVYSTSPFKVLEQEKEEDNALILRGLPRRFWDSKFYEKEFGQFRGGAAPIKVGDHFYMFGHSCIDTPNEKVYFGSVVKFTPDGRVVAASKEPLPLPNPLGIVGPIGKATNAYIHQVVFPAGAVYDKAANEWIVSYGINDEVSAVVRMPHDVVDGLLKPVEHYGSVKSFASVVATSRFTTTTAAAIKEFSVAANSFVARLPRAPAKAKRMVLAWSKNLNESIRDRQQVNAPEHGEASLPSFMGDPNPSLINVDAHPG